MNQPKKLIEVAMPIKEISAESVRDKSIRHGHISTLHLWWARRPLPVCRAVVFASLVPDPMDPNCPQVFKDSVELLLGKANNPGDPYKPYDDIPYTAVIDPMEDNGRNRLMMFIGKFSNDYSINERSRKTTASAKLISEYSLIKSENKNNEKIISKARKLIWVAHNSVTCKSLEELIAEFDSHFMKINEAERDLYNTTDRHLISVDIEVKEDILQDSIKAFLDKMPKVFDPFAGGGAIPLEAARLGCRSFGNDINPVAHIIQKGSLEYPQRFGKSIKFSKAEFIKRYGEKEFKKIKNEKKLFTNNEASEVIIPNRLSFDIQFYSNLIINSTSSEFEYLYQQNKAKLNPLIYYWCRLGKCSNPSCRAEVPLLRQFYLSKRRNYTEKDWFYLNPIIKGISISFEIKRGKNDLNPWNSEGNVTCPCCGNITKVNEIKNQFNTSGIKEKLLAIIYEDKDGKRSFSIPDIDLPVVRGNNDRPNELMPTNDSQNVKVPLWGIKKWGDLFNDRQIVVLNGFVNNFKKVLAELKNQNEENYNVALTTYLAILIDRIITRYNNINVWHNLQETVEHPFGNKSIPMVFDYPEMNPFSSLSGSAFGQIDAIINYVNQESSSFNYSNCVNTTSGSHQQFESKSINAVITDPPYYDAIAYADLSDFFYVWLKRTLGEIYPYNFSTPLTPKSEECTAIKAHFEGDLKRAEKHFEETLSDIFKNVEQQTKEIVSIMFAHQSTKAWTTLCNSILDSNMNITGSWAIDTEQTVALKSNKSFLTSSATVSCKPSVKRGLGEFKIVRNAIEKTVGKEVEELYRLGFRGADLLTACFGQAVSEFGKYEKVEKADGSEVTVAELLEMARESAFNALLKGFEGDDFTKFYIGWLQLYSFTESEFDDAAKFSRVGLSINVQELFTEHILIKNGNKQTLGGFQERLKANKNIGERANNLLIDQVHRARAYIEAITVEHCCNTLAKWHPVPKAVFGVLLLRFAKYCQLAAKTINRPLVCVQTKTALFVKVKR